MVKRITYVDVLKTLAIFGVIVIHISAGMLANIKIASTNWYFYVFWASIVRWSVPVFFMCSGVLFLNPNKEISLKLVYTKYLLRIVLALIFWGCMYEVFDIFKVFVSTGSINTSIIKSSIKHIITCNTHFHLYYLYIIALIYVVVPIIKGITNNDNKQLIEYTLLVWIFFGLLFPFTIKFYPFNLLRGMVLQYAINMAYSSIGYFIMGYYLHRYSLSRRTTYFIYLLGTIGFISTVFGTIKSSSHTINSLFLEGMSPNVAAMAIALFLLIKNLCLYIINDKTSKLIKATKYISKASFCIYLIHDFFNITFRSFGLDKIISSVFISIPILSLLNLILSFLVYLVLSKVPYVKKYLI